MISESLSLFMTIHNSIWLVLYRLYVLTLRNQGFPFLYLWIKVANNLTEGNTLWYIEYLFHDKVKLHINCNPK